MMITDRQLSRRRALTLVVMATGASILAACAAPAPTVPAPAQVAPAPTAAGASSAAATSATPAAASTSDEPKPGGNLRVGAVGDVANVDPQSWGPRNGFSIFIAYDTLTTYDLDLKPQPQLAESWQQSGDGKQLTVNLRKGVNSTQVVS